MADQYKQLTRTEIKNAVKSGRYIPVYDTKTKQNILIQRDGYYSPARLKQLQSL